MHSVSITLSTGGRYDNLVGMFSTSGMQTPCVGVSIGIERVFTIIEKKAEELKLSQSSPIQVRNFHFFYAPILLTQNVYLKRTRI